MSKLKHVAIAIPLIFSLNANKIQAQEKIFGINACLNLGLAITHYPLKVDENWKEDFQGIDSNFKDRYELKREKTFWTGKIDIGFEPYIKLKNNFEMGIPIEFGASHLKEVYRPAQSIIEWHPGSEWRVNDISISKKFPDFGISLKKEIKKKEKRFLEAKLTTYPFKTYERTYDGGIWYNRLIPDSNDKIKEELIEKGWGRKIELNYIIKENSVGENSSLGIYFEIAGKATQLGIVCKQYFDLL